MDFETITELFKDLSGRKVLVAGDLMLDEYLWGDAGRISPEAPVPVVNIVRTELRLGGAGNVALNLATLGVDVKLAGVVGDDLDGREANRILSGSGIDTEGLLVSGERCTTRKSRVIAQQQQMMRIDREICTPLDEELEQRLLSACRQLVAEVDIVLLSDYLKGTLTENLVQNLIGICREKGIPVLVDPKGDDYAKYHGATLLTPNRKELSIAVGRSLPDDKALVAAAETLRERLDLDALVVTRSEEGMSLFVRDEDVRHLPTRAREVFDISGAGDTVLAGLGVALATGRNFVQAVELANLAAGIVVGKVGTSTVLPEEILQEVGREDLGVARKILSWDGLATALEKERLRGRRIVFTNGCFDLLHVGHVKYLEKARMAGDLLVLGLNSDSSIKRLKGEKRPLIGQEERAHILAALDCIDYVVVFNQDTPQELIERVRPDVLIKGGDYEPEQVVGREFVESYGGCLKLIQFVDGKSTSNIIDRILEQYGDA
ncbi:MAG: bifunctional heptose 7-phosphate kinase/heptose 1-phosphate adenyltransferase [Desulfuromonas sp.]|nr:MAG: bifunctional heptose 7-phosphate kinase/heptose 1-phosphate adenyltransferase [Desulfuromonas sp.]